MFICEQTGRVSKPGEPMIKVVVETRARVYTNIIGGEPVESHGTEIVREMCVTKEGLGELLLKRPDLAEQFETEVEAPRWRRDYLKPAEDDEDDLEEPGYGAGV